MLTDVLIPAVDTAALTAAAVAASLATAVVVLVDAVRGQRRSAALHEALMQAAARERRLVAAVLDTHDLTGTQLAGMDFANARLQDAVLRDADLRGAVLRGANLAGADCTRAILERADLAGARCEGTSFVEADLRSASLVGATLIAARLTRANLKNADLTGADLREADLKDALLAFADLRGARLEGAVLVGADTTGARLPEDEHRIPSKAAGDALPIYLVFDVSMSMAGGPVEALNMQILDLCLRLQEDRRIADRVWMSVISFSDKAEVVLPLTRLADTVSVRRLEAHGGTHYGPVFALLRSIIATDKEQLRESGVAIYRPTVVFLSDGVPQDDGWERELDLLLEQQPLDLIAVGIGGADSDVIRRVGKTIALGDAQDSMVEAIRPIGGVLSVALTHLEDKDALSAALAGERLLRLGESED